MITREQAARQAVEILARGAAKAALMSPREAAESAHYPGGPSVDELEARITARRARRIEEGASG